jgi:hypothetical protein
MSNRHRSAGQGFVFSWNGLAPILCRRLVANNSPLPMVPPFVASIGAALFDIHTKYIAVRQYDCHNLTV